MKESPFESFLVKLTDHELDLLDIAVTKERKRRFREEILPNMTPLNEVEIRACFAAGKWECARIYRTHEDYSLLHVLWLIDYTLAQGG